ncbi:TcpQ domain-containing protein [Curvibacter sp. APW13]|uniref:TcpQ domain-containing protein n=1 Tax=Curvibacter sp. APW13 TaxID=3077236 RepID=UPI0028DEA432|nr:TcpQ domain-containing protein [Curvibacter sp. APW13]MDT8992854.1 TcpQ domain-containing protein [Curvibacter sp. APW13]
MQSQITTVVVTQPGAGVTRETPEARKSSADWKQKVESLTGELESSKLAIIDAQAQMLVAAEEERRAAEEQVAAAQRRLEASKKQAERASAYAASLQPVQTSVVAAKPQEVVAPAAIASPATPAPVFTLRRQDRTIPAALTRWAEEAGYTLLWEAREDPASFEETYAKSFPDAVDDVIRDLRLAGRDVRMCEYRNKVVRIVPRAATCKIVPPAESAHVQLGATE